MPPEEPEKSPAAIVKELEQKIAREHPDPAERDQRSEAAEDANPDAAGNGANSVEPPD